MNFNPRNLTDAQLLAVVIGSNNPQRYIDMAEGVLNAYGHNLRLLGRQTEGSLVGHDGISPQKAKIILSMYELARRINKEDVPTEKIGTSADAFNIMRSVLTDLPHEEFWILHLNRASRVIKHERISIGGVSGTVVDMKIVFREALNIGTCSMIVAHNHPSGNTEPSKADIDLTIRLKEAGKMLDISVIDHLIITDNGYYSFADNYLL